MGSNMAASMKRDEREEWLIISEIVQLTAVDSLKYPNQQVPAIFYLR